MTSRRSFLTGASAALVTTLAAPAIVRAESLMRVVVPKPEPNVLAYYYGQIDGGLREAGFDPVASDLFWLGPEGFYTSKSDGSEMRLLTPNGQWFSFNNQGLVYPADIEHQQIFKHNHNHNRVERA